MTDGSKSHPNSRSFPSDRLIALRRSELAKAGRLLGLARDRLFELGLPDSGTPTAGPDFERSVQQVSDILTSSGASNLFVTWKHDPHCDHEAAAIFGEELRRRHRALKLWWYPIWGWHLPPSQAVSAPAPQGLRLAIDEVLSEKQAAIEAHSSQLTDLISDDPDCFRFTEGTLAPFLRPYEYYIEAPMQ
jgi:LmbE family N-acetylglucosaminyl deacetylase